MEKRLTIESLQNPRVKVAVKLRKAKIRKEAGQTLVEGYREIHRAITSNWTFDELYYCPELYLDPEADRLVSALQKSATPTFQCSEPAFRKMSYRDTPDGLLALSPLVGKSLDELDLPDNPLVLIAEGLEKPGNLGTLLRTADATGVDAVVVCGHKTDINNPNVIRASIGTLFFIPIAEASSEKTIQWLAKKNIQILTALPEAPVNYTEADMRKGIALVVGSEDEGLTPIWSKEISRPLSIPMLGRNDSLNVSTAAAVLLYEALRQRTNL